MYTYICVSKATSVYTVCKPNPDGGDTTIDECKQSKFRLKKKKINKKTYT